MLTLNEISQNLINLPRYSKRLIAIFIDVGLCIFCTWLAFYLRLEQFVKINEVTTLAVEISVLLAIPIFWLMGLYKTIYRFAYFVCSLSSQLAGWRASWHGLSQAASQQVRLASKL